MSDYEQSQRVERRIASEMARRINSMLSESQRTALVDSDNAVRQAQDRLRNLTMEIVSDVLEGNRNSLRTFA